MRLISPDGARMNPDHKIGAYGIQDGDQIDVALSQVGGFY